MANQPPVSRFDPVGALERPEQVVRMHWRGQWRILPLALQVLRESYRSQALEQVGAISSVGLKRDEQVELRHFTETVAIV